MDKNKLTEEQRKILQEFEHDLSDLEDEVDSVKEQLKFVKQQRDEKLKHMRAYIRELNQERLEFSEPE